MKSKATTDIPVPTIRRGRPRKHEFDTLEVGESIVLSGGYMTVYGCVRYFVRDGGGNEGRKFVIKAQSARRTRVWRTE